jgi:hypothetical protein
MSMSAGGTQTQFSETLRLPWRSLRWCIGIDVVVTVFFAWLWSIASMSGPLRVGTAMVLLLLLLYLWGGALWFVAAHVVVRDGYLTRRLGRERSRIALDNIVATRVDPCSEWASSKVVLSLRDGAEREIPKRRPDDLLRSLGL